jgi:exonuclease SbcD
LVAGDLFDSANPPASAQAMLYRFVVEAQRRLPKLQMVLIAGNHDSAARLEAPSPVLEALNVRVVGTPRRSPDGALDCERLTLPLYDKDGAIAAWCAAVPFLRPSDLQGAGDQDEDPLVTGVSRLYGEVLDALEQTRTSEQAIIAMGHCYMVGGNLSELSERKILGGNQHALPVSLFPVSVSYAALGHLHLAQCVGGQEHIRYSGSPIPLSLDERHYKHQVLQLDLQGAELGKLEALQTPRSVEILRFPNQGSGEVESVMQALSEHLFDDELPASSHPYVEVAVRLERPDPSLRRRVEEILEGKAARLLKLSSEYAGSASGLTPAKPAQRLDELQPDGVFRERYRQQYENEPPTDLMAAFDALLEQVQGAEQ